MSYSVICEDGIKRDSRAAGKYFQRIPRCGARKVKAIASRDISEECGLGKLYTKNYLYDEATILMINEVVPIHLELK